MLRHGKNSRDKCGSAIVISGCARSGTSVVGKLVHSFKNVEYCYEPPLLVSLFSIIDAIEANYWMLLYETYLYEEILLNSICGRSINCNSSDYSSIFEVKNRKDIHARLYQSKRKVDTEAVASSSCVAYKIPDIVPKLERLKQYYPEAKIVLTRRKAEQVFFSILQKKWLSDESLSDSTDIIFPCRIVADKRVPFWVLDDDIDYWLSSDELHRIAYYYLKMNNVNFSNFTSMTVINYDSLVLNPNGVAKQLAKQLGLKFGDKTQDVISSISRKSESPSFQILKGLDPAIFSEVMYWSER